MSQATDEPISPTPIPTPRKYPPWWSNGEGLDASRCTPKQPGKAKQQVRHVTHPDVTLSAAPGPSITVATQVAALARPPSRSVA